MHSIKFTASVIISTFNRTCYIDQLLISLAKQSYIDDVEIFIIEAGSHDSYLAVLEICSNFQLNISVIHKPNLTLGEARNYGVSISSGYWCFFSDDDDVWCEEKIQKVKATFESYDVISHQYVASKSPCLSDFSEGKSFGKAIFYSFGSIVENFWGNRYGGGSSLSGRRSVFEVIKFNEKMRSCEDIEWILRALLSGARMGFVEQPLVCYRIHENRMTRSVLKNVVWDFYLIKRYLIVSFSLLAGVFFKFIRILIRLFVRR